MQPTWKAKVSADPTLQGPVLGASSLMDVASHCFGLAEIESHVHRYDKKVAETVARQRRVARKWWQTREALHERLKWSRPRIRDWQLSRVSTLVDWAFNTIPFYRSLYSKSGFRTGDIVTWEDFASLPLVTRQDLTLGFPQRQVLAGVNPELCYGARTSGSSGVPMTIVRDDGSEELQSLLRMRQFEVMLGSQLRPTDWIYNIYLSSWAFTSFDGEFPVFSISEDCPPQALVQHIEQLRPRLVSAFPSVLARMATTKPVNMAKSGVSCICTNSEGSSRTERDMIAEAFGVPVFDEYASEEMSGVIASECIAGNYHVVEDRVVAEVTNVDSDGLGDIVVTDMANIFMPIIRYAQGDLVRLSAEDAVCGCGNCFRHFDRFMGRADQALHSPSIGRVPSDRVMNLCDRTLVDFASGVAAFRIIQSVPETVDVMMVLRPGFTVAEQASLEALTVGLRDLFQYPIGITPIYLPDLPDASSYKRRMVINLLR